MHTHVADLGAGSTTGARALTRPYLPVPTQLILTYHHRPAVIGIYASIARLNVIRKAAVGISRADFAHWSDRDRDTLGGCIKRGIDDLEADGWLLTERRVGGKTQMLAAWGWGAHRRARPWRFDTPTRARPSRVSYVALPLDVCDLGLGRLRPDDDGPAVIERYVDQALLSYHDIGVYALNQITGAVPTAHLQAVCQPSNDSLAPLSFPMLPALLAHVVAGTLLLSDDELRAPVRLSPIGQQYWDRHIRRPALPHVVQGGSAIDQGALAGGSAGGSAQSIRKNASQCAKSGHQHPARGAWDEHGIHELINNDPSSHESYGTTAMTTNDHQQTMRIQPVPSAQGPTQQTLLEKDASMNSSVACEENHITGLDPRVWQWHQALNPQRCLAPAEQFAVLHLQERYGIDALKRWQCNASSANKTVVLPSYYQQCAAQDACAVRPPRTVYDPILGAPQSPVEPVPPTSSRPRRAAAARTTDVDAVHATLIAEIGHRAQGTIRCPEKLAHVPLDLLARWRAIAAHPGLRARWQLGWLVNEMARGHEPPTHTELDRWAEAHGMSVYDPQLAAVRADAAAAVLTTEAAAERAVLQATATPAMDAAPVDAQSDVVGAVGAETDDPATDAQLHRPDIAEPLTVARWISLRRVCVARADRAGHAALRALTLQRVAADMVTIGAPDTTIKTIIEAKYLPLIRDVLAEELGYVVHVRVVIAPPSDGAITTGMPSFAPLWIDPRVWHAVPTALQALLADSQLRDDGALDVHAAAYTTLCAQWDAEVRTLMQAARGQLSPTNCCAPADTGRCHHNV